MRSFCPLAHAGLLKWQDYGNPVTVIGLLCQTTIYIAVIVISRYLNALGVAVVVIPLDAAVIICSIIHRKER